MQDVHFACSAVFGSNYLIILAQTLDKEKLLFDFTIFVMQASAYQPPTPAHLQGCFAKGGGTT